MSISTVLRSHTTAWLLGGALLAGASVFAHWLVGWIGIGTIGLLGLVISTNIALYGGYAMADSGFGTGDLLMYARQLEASRKSQSSPEQKMAAEAVRRERSRVLYLINSIFIAMATLGFWMFIQHEL